MIAKNNLQTNLSIYIGEGNRLEIPASGQVNLLATLTRFEISNSDIAYHIDEEDITLNNGDNDLTKLIALRWVYDAPPADELRDRSGKLRVHQTSRKLGTGTCWMGIGDDASDPHKVGSGEEMTFEYNTASGTTTLTKYIDYNCVNNETWLHEGYITWKNAHFDTLTLEMVPRVTTYTASSGTYYNLYGGYMVVPAAGDGTIELTSDITQHDGGLVYMPDNDLGEAPTAFWNADWNTSTKEYENITAAPYGDGRYNMFTVELVLARFLNKAPFLASGFIVLNSSDTDQMGHGMRLKMTFDIADHNGVDEIVGIACIMCLHRDKSC